MNSESVQDIENTLVCSECIDDELLKQQIIQEGTQEACNYCNFTGSTIRLMELWELINEVYQKYYEPSWCDECEGEELYYVIQDIGVSTPEVIDAVIVLGEVSEWRGVTEGTTPMYDKHARYLEKYDAEHAHFFLWKQFKTRAKHLQRFFDKKQLNDLEEIFREIQTLGGEGEQVVDYLEPDQTIYRARLCKTDEAYQKICKDPCYELSAPPPKLACAGRMNSNGITVFYGSFDKDTCVSEIRPPVGSKVAIGLFQPIRKLKVLDLTRFNAIFKSFRKTYQPMSFFDSQFEQKSERFQHLKFLCAFHDEISKPIMPHEVSLEQVPTQIMAEYIACELGYDGLIYGSAQKDKAANNIVLFRDAAIVQRDENHNGIQNNLVRNSNDYSSIISLPPYISFPPGHKAINIKPGLCYVRKSITIECIQQSSYGAVCVYSEQNAF